MGVGIWSSFLDSGVWEKQQVAFPKRTVGNGVPRGKAALTCEEGKCGEGRELTPGKYSIHCGSTQGQGKETWEVR